MYTKRYGLQAGFSLVEIMVACSIVGVLASIAVVNYSNYQAKARMSEAKIGLTAIYAAERSFYSQYYSYIQGMDAIAYTPSGNKRFYTVGWTTASQAGTVPSYRIAATTASYARTNYPANWNDCALSALSTLPGSSVTNSTTFTVVSTGQIRDGYTTAGCDTWTINEGKKLSHTLNGI